MKLRNTRQDEEEYEGDSEEDENKDDGEEYEDEEGEVEGAANSANSNKGNSSQKDNVQAYAKEVMTLGLLNFLTVFMKEMV